MENLDSLLLSILMELLRKGGFEIPAEMDEEQSKSFAFHALENSNIVPADEYGRLVAAARFVVSNRDTESLQLAVQALAESLKPDTTPIEPWLLIICQGGLVEQVVSVPDKLYEVCDLDVFSDDREPEAVEYFESRSARMKAHLLTSWRLDLPSRVIEAATGNPAQAPPAENEDSNSV